MSKPDAEKEIEKLRAKIRNHDYKYYVEAAPQISDRDYDRLIDRLKELEAAHPELITPDSPTQRIGDAPVENLPQVRHAIPMLSMDNTYSVEELKKYGERIQKMLPGEQIEWVVELKIDGVAVAVTFEDGLLVRGATRGNGVVGDDITHNIRTLDDVPLRLHGDPPPLVEVRGEVYMTNPDLVRLNEQQKAKGQQLYANTRNCAAGSIRLLDPRIAAQRHLHLFCHGVGYSEGLKAKTHMEFLAELRNYGLPVTPHVKSFPNFDAAVEHCESLIERLHELDFEVDGLVLKVNNFEQREHLGSTSKSPRWLVAYKFEKYEAPTRVNEIGVSVGRTGAITPLAYLEPVQLANTTVVRASLHNADEIERKDVRAGDIVLVEKAGKVIPHIVRVEKHERKGELPKFKFPTTCPVCGTKLVKDEGGVYIRCPNLECPAQVMGRIRHYATRNGMDIEGLGDKLVEQLVSSELVRTYGDLYRLTEEQLLELERMGERSTEKLLTNIEASKTRGLARLLNSLSIRHVGTRVASILAEHFQTMDALRTATLEQLSEAPEIGPIIAQSVYDTLHSDSAAAVIDDLASQGVLMQSTERRPTGKGPLAGKTIVVTGTLEKYKRDEIENLIAQLGGKIASSVSKSTDFVVAGEKAGSKLDKAQKLGVQVLSEQDFDNLIQG